MELTAEAHKEEQATCKESNKTHEGHKHITRTAYNSELLDEFKSGMKFHDDQYIENFINVRKEN